MKNKVEFRNGPEGQELYLYTCIGGEDGISAGMFANALQYLGGSDFTLRINSPGGVISEGMAIYNLIKSYSGKVTARVDGMAASIASVIAMGAGEVIMGNGSMMMIHLPATESECATADDLRKLADDLDKYQASIVAVYVEATGKTPEEITAMMKAETYMTAAEAVAQGFADSVSKLDAAAISNSSPMNFFNTYKNAAPMATAFAAAKVDFTPEAFAALAAKAAKADEAETLIASAVAAASADVEAAKAQAKDAADKLAAAEAALAKANTDHAAALASLEAEKAVAVQNAQTVTAKKTGEQAAKLVAAIGFKAPIKGTSGDAAQNNLKGLARAINSHAESSKK